MSKEWLAQFSATAAAKQGRRVLRPLAQPRPQSPAAAAARTPDIHRRGFIGAIIGSIIRWTVISAIAGAILVFVVSSNEYLAGSLGEKVSYTIWYLYDEFLLGARFFGTPTIDADAVNGALKPYAELLPYLVPLVLGVAVTLLFLPTVNAYRRRSGGRFFILLLNLAVLTWIWRSQGIIIDLSGKEGWINDRTFSLKALIPWAILLLFSFIGVRRVRSSLLRPTPAPAHPAMARGNASAPRVPSHAASAATHNVSPTQMNPQHRSGPTVDRSVSGRSWRRSR
jgi:hypothetical protein